MVERPEVPPLRPPSMPLSFTAGFLMGAADSVPGVSGGTIALIVGVYERFIRSLSLAIRAPRLWRTPEGRGQLRGALRLLVPLMIGLLLAYYLGTLLLVGRTESPGLLRRGDTAPLCYAFFFGLVCLSLPEPWRRIRPVRPVHVVALVLAAAAAAWFTGMPHARSAPPLWALVPGGAAAVSVMLLPGVSGSLFLLVVGQYTTVASAVHDRDVGTLLVFLGGVVLGVVLFVPLLRALLRRFHGLTMAALTGLMAGSLRALWPWKDQYDPKSGPMDNRAMEGPLLPVLAALVAGALAAWGLGALERHMRAPGDCPDD